MIGLAQQLDADLVELAVAALLRTLAAKHGADVVQLHVARPHLHSVLDVGADGGGRRLWTQTNLRTNLSECVVQFAEQLRKGLIIFVAQCTAGKALGGDLLDAMVGLMYFDDLLFIRKCPWYFSSLPGLAN